VVKKLLQSFWPMWPNHETVVNISELTSRVVVCCVQCCFLKVFHKYTDDHSRS
jgi:hypothetical protein